MFGIKAKRSGTEGGTGATRLLLSGNCPVCFTRRWPGGSRENAADFPDGPQGLPLPGHPGGEAGCRRLPTLLHSQREEGTLAAPGGDWSLVPAQALTLSAILGKAPSPSTQFPHLAHGSNNVLPTAWQLNGVSYSRGSELDMKDWLLKMRVLKGKDPGISFLRVCSHSATF